MTNLHYFVPCTRLACCATCTHLTLGASIGKQRKAARNTWACEVHRMLLAGDLQAMGCAEWRQERRETFQVALYRELEEGGAT